MDSKDLDLQDEQEQANSENQRGQVAEEPQPGPADAPDVQAIAEERDRLAAEVDRLARENAVLRDQALRQRAEFDNFRKRLERERREAREYAALDLVRELLPVLDGLERALALAPDDEDEVHRGVRLVARHFHEVLGKFGLEPIEALGKTFDPNVHEAVDRVETTQHEDHTIVDEWQRGYLFRGKLLRPAMVRVAVHPQSQ